MSRSSKLVLSFEGMFLASNEDVLRTVETTQDT